MFKAVFSIENLESGDADKVVHLTLPVLLEPGDSRASRVEGHYLALPARSAAPEVYPNAECGSGAAWQVRIDMTLRDAEDLAERLRSLIVAAREHAAPPAALAWAGLKIGAEPPWRRPAASKSHWKR